MVAPKPDILPDLTVETRVRVMVRREQAGMLVPLQDWDSLVERVEDCTLAVQPLAVAYSLFVGIGATASLSVTPIGIAALPSWVTTAYPVTARVELAIAERLLAQRQRSQIEYVTRDMRRTKDSYLQPADQS